MSTCISRHGEFGSHEYGEGIERFVCQLCGVLDEDAMLAALTEAEAERDRLQAERDLQLSLSGDDWLRDQHARYHDEPGNMFAPGECGWDRCWFIEVAEWVLNAPRAERTDPVRSEAVRRKVEDLICATRSGGCGRRSTRANETAKDYADEVAAAHAERDELKAELDRTEGDLAVAVHEAKRWRQTAEAVGRELQGLVSRYTVADENALRVVNLLHQDAYRIGAKLLEQIRALDGAE